MQAASGIHDKHVAAGVHSFAARFLGETLDGRSVCFPNLAFVNLSLDRRRNYLELLARCGTINVHRDQQRMMAPVLEPMRQFAGGRRFARTLQSRHEDNCGWLRGKFHPRRIFAQNLHEFIADNLDNLLSRR